MSYSINVRTDLPLLVSTWDSSFELKTEVKSYSDEIKIILDARTDPLYYLIDFRDWKDISLENVMMASNLAARAGNSNFHHRMVKGIFFVTGNGLVEMTARGMKSDIYGNLAIRVFSTVDEALDFLRKP